MNKTRVTKRVVLKQKSGSGLQISFPFGPTEVTFDNYGLTYSQINRPDLKPLLVSTGPELRTISFEAYVADKGSAAKESVHELLNKVETIAAEDVDCEFVYGLVSIEFPVRVTRVSTTVTQHNIDGLPLKARVSFQLTESIEIPSSGVSLAVVGGNASPTTPTSSSGSGSFSPSPPSSKDLPDFVEECKAESKCGGSWQSPSGGGGGTSTFI